MAWQRKTTALHDIAGVDNDKTSLDLSLLCPDVYRRSDGSDADHLGSKCDGWKLMIPLPWTMPLLEENTMGPRERSLRVWYYGLFTAFMGPGALCLYAAPCWWGSVYVRTLSEVMILSNSPGWIKSPTRRVKGQFLHVSLKLDQEPMKLWICCTCMLHT